MLKQDSPQMQLRAQIEQEKEMQRQQELKRQQEKLYQNDPHNVPCLVSIIQIQIMLNQIQ